MDEKEKRKRERWIMFGSFLLLACAAGYLLYAALVLKRLGPEYYVVIFGCLFLFWLLSDVGSIILTRGFEGKTEQQVKAYMLYALMDLAGLAGLGYFAVSMNGNGGLIGACIYAFTMMGKRKYKEEYQGIVNREEEEGLEENREEPEKEEIKENREETEKEAGKENRGERQN